MTNEIQLLTFALASEIYAIDVGRTREVVEFTHITPIPKTPPWIRGVLNLRGSVVPVLDLKQKLAMGPTEQSRDACVLILEIALEGERTLVGVLADSVREVLELDATEIDPPPNFGARLSTDYIRGVGRRNGELFVVLDVERIFLVDELTLAQTSVQSPPTLDVENSSNDTTEPTDVAPPQAEARISV